MLLLLLCHPLVVSMKTATLTSGTQARLGLGMPDLRQLQTLLICVLLEILEDQQSMSFTVSLHL